MSLLGDIGGLLNTGLSAFQTIQAARAPRMQMVASMPALNMGAMPAALPAAVGAAGGMIVRGAGTAMRSAVAYCKRNPAWCSTIGGTAAVAAMVQNGQLPPVKRRRGRGLSSRDLRSYRRVHNLLAGFCTPKARIKKSC